MGRREKRVIVALGVAFFILIGAGVYQSVQLPRKISFKTTGHPTVGKGPIHLVLFEDLSCFSCHNFTRDVIPKISSEYLDTDRAQLTIVPVSFEQGSIHLANAALAVYRISSSRFLPFLIELLNVAGDDRTAILKVAERVGGIDLERLSDAIDRKIFFGEIERNLVWATSVIPNFGTPMLFVEGYETSTSSFEALQRRINQLRME